MAPTRRLCSWTSTACGGYRVLHSSPVANLNLLDTADPDALEYYLVPEYTTAPAILSSVPAKGASVPKSTTSMSITFDHLMGSVISYQAHESIGISAVSCRWSHNFSQGRSTLNLYNLDLTNAAVNVDITFSNTMTDCDGYALGGDRTISFTTY